MDQNEGSSSSMQCYMVPQPNKRNQDTKILLPIDPVSQFCFDSFFVIFPIRRICCSSRVRIFNLPVDADIPDSVLPSTSARLQNREPEPEPVTCSIFLDPISRRATERQLPEELV